MVGLSIFYDARKTRLSHSSCESVTPRDQIKAFFSCFSTSISIFRFLHFSVSICSTWATPRKSNVATCQYASAYASTTGQRQKAVTRPLYQTKFASEGQQEEHGTHKCAVRLDVCCYLWPENVFIQEHTMMSFYDIIMQSCFLTFSMQCHNHRQGHIPEPLLTQ